jgi:hypothetical protein
MSCTQASSCPSNLAFSVLSSLSLPFSEAAVRSATDIVLTTQLSTVSQLERVVTWHLNRCVAGPLCLAPAVAHAASQRLHGCVEFKPDKAFKPMLLFVV